MAVVTTSMSINLVASFRGLSLTSSSSSSFVKGGFRASSLSFPTKSPLSVSPFPLTIESAHKKGAGSTNNGRDSKGQRLGVKIYGDQVAKPGIIVRQIGSKILIDVFGDLYSEA